VREAELEEELGALTWQDVVAELETPGRDPRGPFVPFRFREDVRKLEDLRAGMACPGIVTNVTSFGAFVDIGVHHDGLVHVSQLGARHGKSAKALGAGDRVEVRVLKVDLEKKQISLTLRPAAERRPASKPRAAQPAAAEPRRARPERPRAPAAARHGPRPSRAPVPSPEPRTVRPRPERAHEARPSPGKPGAERRPEPRRQVFNNPFAVLASLKVPRRRTETAFPAGSGAPGREPLP
jgi:transcriptional accessory protein Tex/SPT6